MRNSPLEAGFRWLRQTEEDMRRTRHLAHQGANRLACFLAQQVTEKALKALLYSRGEEIVLGHSVQRLCQRAAVHDPQFEARGQLRSIVDGYYMPARYPNAPPDDIPAEVYTREAAEDAVDIAAHAAAFVTSRVIDGAPQDQGLTTNIRAAGLLQCPISLPGAATARSPYVTRLLAHLYKTARPDRFLSGSRLAPPAMPQRPRAIPASAASSRPAA